MASPEPKYVQNEEVNDVTFSVCSLVRDQEKYDRLLASFAEHGFTPENSEFLAADNRKANQFDGYSWHRHMWPECRGEYVIYCHEDVELIGDGFDELLAALKALDEEDPRWLVAGVAGSPWRPLNHSFTNAALHITDVFGSDRRRGTVPARVETLDECFIVMRRRRPVLNSYDLSGFHYYGPDICLQAELLGGTAYAIEFHIHHYGRAIGDESFKKSRQAFCTKYRKYFPGRIMHATTGRFALGGGWYDAR